MEFYNDCSHADCSYSYQKSGWKEQQCLLHISVIDVKEGQEAFLSTSQFFCLTRSTKKQVIMSTILGTCKDVAHNKNYFYWQVVNLTYSKPMNC